MPIVLSIDIGTTTITALALDGATGELAACVTAPNEAETTSPGDKARGYSEWDARRMVDIACRTLRATVQKFGARVLEIAGLGITGQQHGGVLVDDQSRPLSPLVNWQDRRVLEIMPNSSQSFLSSAQQLAGAEASERTGCRLHAGFMAVTLYWLKERGLLPRQAMACLIMDYFAALLTGTRPVTDATCGGSFGVLNLRDGDWDDAILAALELPRSLFPPVVSSGGQVGALTPEMAAATGLPIGLPVFGAIGDNQASFLGSVSNRAGSVLVNVGTGGQVAAFVDSFKYDVRLETRPYPRGGFLLVCPGLCGGRTYAALERFFRQVGEQVLGISPSDPLYPAMNQLAAYVPPGADGLKCEPYFTGTRQNPEMRASLSGMSPENFTPAHMTRALLEGMARAFRIGFDAIRSHLPHAPTQLIGAGNGIRENPLLARLVAEEFQLRLAVPSHREEAAYGAALMAAVGAGICKDVISACHLIRYERPSKAV